MPGQSKHEDILKLLRLQRHDFINHIQVVQALIQLGKNEKALRYIEDMIKSPEMTGDLASYLHPAEGKSAE